MTVREISVLDGKETGRSYTRNEKAANIVTQAEYDAGATQREIWRLEAMVTPRRIREAFTDPKWVQNQEALILTQRQKL